MVDFLSESLLDSFLDQFVKEAAPKKSREEMKETQKRELELWHTWNKNKKPEHLQPLYESYKPFLNREAQKYVNRVELPTSTIHAEIDKHFVNAVKTFNPARGTQLNTWVQTNLQKASRFIKTYQNFGKIPEGQISQIRRFDAAKEHLYNQLGHEPDTKTMAEHLGWSQRRVVQMVKERRKALPASGFESDPAELLMPKELEAIKLMQYDLTPEERTVYEYTFGVNGKPRYQPGQIARTTNIHPSKVSRIRNKLVDKLKEAMELV